MSGQRAGRDGFHRESDAKVVRYDERDRRILRIVNHLSRHNIGRCTQCLTCSSVCPFNRHMDVLPNRVIRLVQLGQTQEVLNCRTIWICVGCHTCSSHCPTGVDMASIMDSLRQLALRQGIKPCERDIAAFHQHVYDSIRRHGRLHKLESLIHFKLSTGKWFEDLDMGIKLMVKGKLDLLAANVKDRQEVERIFRYYEDRRETFRSAD